MTLAKDVLAQIIERGEVTRGWFGVEPHDVDGAIAQALSLSGSDGAVIRGLQPDGPADRAGLRLNDVVLTIDGRPTPNTQALLSRVAELVPGSRARVNAVRDGKPVTVDVAVGRRPRYTP